MWKTLKDAGVEVPSLHQAKKFKLPDFVPPIRVRSYITISVATHFCYAGSISFKCTILYVVNFINHFSLPWKQQGISSFRYPVQTDRYTLVSILCYADSTCCIFY